MSAAQPPRLMHYRPQPIALDPTRVYEQLGPSTFGKPRGLWVSVEGTDDFPSWWMGRGFGATRIAVAHEVRLAPSADVLVLHSDGEIHLFRSGFASASDVDVRCGYSADRWGIDWREVARCYDGIVIAPHSRSWHEKADWYYTWECASGCIWNLAAIESVDVVSAVVS